MATAEAAPSIQLQDDANLRKTKCPDVVLQACPSWEGSTCCLCCPMGAQICAVDIDFCKGAPYMLAGHLREGGGQAESIRRLTEQAWLGACVAVMPAPMAALIAPEACERLAAYLKFHPKSSLDMRMQVVGGVCGAQER